MNTQSSSSEEYDENYLHSPRCGNQRRYNQSNRGNQHRNKYRPNYQQSNSITRGITTTITTSRIISTTPIRITKTIAFPETINSNK